MTLEFGTADLAMLGRQHGDRLAGFVPMSRDDWDLMGVTVACATVELRRDTVRARIPKSLGMTRPAMGRIVVMSVDDSPVGAFSLGLLAISTRTEMVMRDWVVDAVAFGDVAALSSKLGMCVRSGTIRLIAKGARLVTHVEDDSGVLLDLSMSTTSINAGLVRVDPWVFPVPAPGGVELQTVSLDILEAEAGVDHDFSLSCPESSPWAELLRSPWRVTSLVTQSTIARLPAADDLGLSEDHDIVTVHYS